MGIIYCITNLVNNKIYIGQTHRILQERWNEHLTAGKDINNNRPLYKAMRKYGENNFSIDILEKCPDDELDEKERYWIKEKQSWIAKYPDKGYNITCGGGNGTKYSYDYIRLLYKNGMTQSEIKDELKCDPWVIRQAIMTDDTILPAYKQEQRHIAAKRGQQSLMKQVQAIDPVTGEIYKIFNSIAEASKFFNINHSCISTAIRKRKPHKCKNYYWEYCNKNEIARTAVSVISIDIITNQQIIYPSIAAAARECNLNSSNIIEAINKNWRCGKWKWKYNKENINE